MDEIEGRLASLMRSMTAADTSLGVPFEVRTNTGIHNIFGLGRGSTRFTLHLWRRAVLSLPRTNRKRLLVILRLPNALIRDFIIYFLLLIPYFPPLRLEINQLTSLLAQYLKFQSTYTLQEHY